MWETALRRDRDRHLVGGDEDRLAELAIPRTELLLDALERRELEVGAVDEGGHGGEIVFRLARDRLADGARGNPGLMVDG